MSLYFTPRPETLKLIEKVHSLYEKGAGLKEISSRIGKSYGHIKNLHSWYIQYLKEKEKTL
jgi:hypothetical protein